MDKVTSFFVWLYNNRLEVSGWIFAAMVAWTPFATFLARFVKRPPATSSWIKRALFDLFIDTPALMASLERVGIFGGKFNLPGVPSRLPVDNSPPISVPVVGK